MCTSHKTSRRGLVLYGTAEKTGGEGEGGRVEQAIVEIGRVCAPVCAFARGGGVGVHQAQNQAARARFLTGGANSGRHGPGES